MSQTLAERVEAALKKLPDAVRQDAKRQLAAVAADSDLTIDRLRRALSAARERPDLSSAAAWLIGLTGLEEMAPALEELADESTPAAALWEVVKALVALQTGHRSLRRLLASASDVEAKRAAVYGLGFLRDRGATGALTAIARGQDQPPALRGQALEALGYIGDPESFAVLAKAARDSAAEVRFWAAFALGEIGDRRARPVLEEMKRDHAEVEGWWEVSKEARQALEKLDGLDQDPSA